jgi:hypothetical protein
MPDAEFQGALSQTEAASPTSAASAMMTNSNPSA